jgi:hypothetical protein
MITAPRAFLLLTGAAVAVSAPPAIAQVPESVTLNIMRECAKIEDPTARLACYDNNIRAAGGNPRSIPGQMAAPNGGGAVFAAPTASGFGADDLVSSSPQRFHPSGPGEIAAHVASARERQPGVYLVTLDSGAQWLFAESGGRNYSPPRKGDTVTIERGALGSYLMVVGKQQAVHVTRVK